MLQHPSGQSQILPPIRPNVGVEVQYRKKLDRLISEMHHSILYWMKIKYRNNKPRMAQDSPASELQREMDKLGRRWTKRFNASSKELGKYFAANARNRSDAQMKRILKEAGFAVEFKMTPHVRDVFTATIEQQVGLIKSIASEHLQEVQGLVMRSVQEGRDLHYLTEALQRRYHITRRRAAFIARDQNNKATATITRARQQQLGITKAVWLHSMGGKHPRPEHIAFSKGTHSGPNKGPVYDIAKGAFLEGKWTWPGVEINCRCVSRSIIPGIST